jgi:hypothetical protein
VTIKGRNFPLESLSSLQTISVNPTTKFANTRARSRQSAVRIENTSNSFGWRLGDIRLDLRTDGRK